MAVKPYTVVIPMYNCASDVRKLVANIKRVTPTKYLPERIIISDDASTDDDCAFLGNVLSTSAVPIDHFTSEVHMGYAGAAKHGIDNVDTENVILLHSDTRIGVSPTFTAKTKPVISDTLGVLATLIDSHPDIVAVAPFTLNMADMRMIYGGMRAGTREGIPHSWMAGKYFQAIRQIAMWSWNSVLSLDTYCVCFKMSAYHEYPFDVSYNHFFFFDDWCFHHRSKGKHVYITSDTCTVHPRSKDYPDGSSAIATEESYTGCLMKWREKWLDSGLLRYNSTRIRPGDGPPSDLDLAGNFL